MSNKKNSPKGKNRTTTRVEPAIAAPVVDTTTIGRFDRLRATLDAIRTTPRLTPDTAGDVVARAIAAMPADTPAATHNRCRFTGLPVAVAQNALFVMNETDGWHFTDDVLAVAWAVMFPTNNANIAGGAGFTANVTKYIGGTRSLYNHHKHGALPPDMTFRPAQSRAAVKSQKSDAPVDAPVPNAETVAA